MSAPRSAAWAALFTVAAGLLTSTLLPAQEEAPPPVVVPKKDDGITVLARGPIHEAFAQPTEANPEPTPVVPKKPPVPVPEVPPDQKPKAENVQWIPGYWAWDLEKKDFIWVSGVWRVPPPGRKWLPGHWHQTDGGWQWVSGFWARADQTELRYLQEPPGSLDNGPSSPKPDEDSSYIPGTWVPRGDSFAWRPGFWNNNYSEWIWNPDGYYWTPNGYLYNNGYWDYNLENRGLIFAPVYFNQPFWNTPGWTYTPSYCVGFGGLFNSLFFGPNNWFYFGNFYSPFYRAWGFRPWAFWGPRWGNTLWNHYAWRNRFNPGWAANQRNLAVARFNRQAPLPANTLAGQHAQLQNVNAAQRNNVHMVTPLTQMGTHTPLTNVSAAQQSQFRTMGNQFHQNAITRGWNEGTRTNSTGGAGGNVARFPSSPGSQAMAGPRNTNVNPAAYRSFYSGSRMPATGTPAYRAPTQSPRSVGAPVNRGMPAYRPAPGGFRGAPTRGGGGRGGRR